MKDIYPVLDELHISYEKFEHPAVFTVEEAEKQVRGDGADSKNLFLRNRKGNVHYLVVVPATKKVNLKNLEVQLSENNLSFASPERMMKYLGLTPGSVSPFGLINDVNHEVHVVVDSELLQSPKQAFHPNTNTATVVISTEDFKKFLDWTGNPVQYMEIS